ncbi:NAD(P)H-quinone oxidoreductase [Shewanella sp. GXUN23E]|uniref:NAD(P)H-quinone oxidoreductase n=1 Tax=Shewanella sp. GXUN23E TaxID=3422498 RepID=UPI003D7EFDC9
MLPINLPDTYQHIQFTPGCSPEEMTLTTSPVPQPEAHQVLIKVHAAGVNGPDVAQRKGVYPAPEGASPILGLEVAGEIVALGQGVSRWQVGDKVCALVPGGGYGQYVLTHSEHCLSIPDGMDMAHAAVLPEALFTVWGNLVIRGRLRLGETLLVHGGSGGIGSAAIAVGKALGAKVIVTCGSQDKCDYCLELGADAALNYKDDDLLEQILDASARESKSASETRGGGVDLVLDQAGGEMVNLSMKALNTDGRMVSVAMQQSRTAEVDLFRLMAKRISWTGSTLRPQSDAAKAEIASQLEQAFWPTLNGKAALLPIYQSFALADAGKAHVLMESGQHRGKIVLTVNHE